MLLITARSAPTWPGSIPWRRFMSGRRSQLLLYLAVTLTVIITGPEAFAQVSEQTNAQSSEAPNAAAGAKLAHATMCERVDNLMPTRAGLVFSVSAGQVCCFTSFDPVPQPSLVYHRWFHRDQLSTQTRLRVYRPNGRPTVSFSCARRTKAPGGWKSPTRTAGSSRCSVSVLLTSLFFSRW